MLAGGFEPPDVLLPPQLGEPGARRLQGLDQLLAARVAGVPGQVGHVYQVTLTPACPLAELEPAMDAAAEPGGPLVVVDPTA